MPDRERVKEQTHTAAWGGPWFAGFLILSLSAVALSGCFSGSSSGNGNGNDEQANGENGTNGDTGPQRDIAKAEVLYFHASEGVFDPSAELVAVDPEFPALQKALDPPPQDNAKAPLDVDIHLPWHG